MLNHLLLQYKIYVSGLKLVEMKRCYSIFFLAYRQSLGVSSVAEQEPLCNASENGAVPCGQTLIYSPKALARG